MTTPQLLAQNTATDKEEKSLAIKMLIGLVNQSSYIEKVNQLLFNIKDSEKVECPVTHRFTPGLYIREIFMPKDTLIVSAIHKYEHPFVISQGAATVYDRFNKSQLLKAPHTGITQPGTCRVLYIEEDCIWTTFHTTQETDVETILDDILIKYEFPYIGTPDYLKQLKQLKSLTN